MGWLLQGLGTDSAEPLLATAVALVAWLRFLWHLPCAVVLRRARPRAALRRGGPVQYLYLMR